jgi:hypothetical protein
MKVSSASLSNNCILQRSVINSVVIDDTHETNLAIKRDCDCFKLIRCDQLLTKY